MRLYTEAVLQHLACRSLDTAARHQHQRRLMSPPRKLGIHLCQIIPIILIDVIESAQIGIANQRDHRTAQNLVFRENILCEKTQRIFQQNECVRRYLLLIKQKHRSRIRRHNIFAIPARKLYQSHPLIRKRYDTELGATSITQITLGTLRLTRLLLALFLLRFGLQLDDDIQLAFFKVGKRRVSIHHIRRKISIYVFLEIFAQKKTLILRKVILKTLSENMIDPKFAQFVACIYISKLRSWCHLAYLFI